MKEYIVERFWDQGMIFRRFKYKMKNRQFVQEAKSLKKPENLWEKQVISGKHIFEAF